MKTFEYEQDLLPDEEQHVLIEKLMQRGAEGWRLNQMIRPEGWTSYVLIYEREQEAK